MKKLFAGPFVGEFGHELFCYHGKIRRMAKEFDFTTVICTSGKEILYEDFADEIIIYSPETYEPDCSVNKGITQNFPTPDNTYNAYIPPNTQLIPLYDPEQDFIPLGNGTSELPYDYIFAARQTNKINTGYRDWDPKKWDELADKLIKSGKRIASIGLASMSYHVKGTDNLLDIPLKELANIISSSNMVVGGSSGPMHFTTLCKTKHLVWSGDNIKINRLRYEDWWNPFKVEVLWIDAPEWNPTVEEIYNKIRNNE